MRLAPLALILLGACTSIKDIGREPVMTPVGSGLYAARAPLPIDAFPAPSKASYHSLWDDSRANLYQDPRATQIGDILTVKIRINDKATIDNSSRRQRDAAIGQSASYEAATSPNSGPGFTASGGGSFGLGGKSGASGTGSIDRSEKVDISVAAVVTEVLPNGNLLISGSQEVRVNFELRLINVTGIVRPRDISTNNTIDYEKIAEARISYGGRGRISEIQQPRLGHQIIDAITPF